MCSTTFSYKYGIITRQTMEDVTISNKVIIS